MLLGSRKKRTKSVHFVRRPPAKIIDICRKLKIRITTRRGGRRVYKTVATLKKLIRKLIHKKRKQRRAHRVKKVVRHKNLVRFGPLSSLLKLRKKEDNKPSMYFKEYCGRDPTEDELNILNNYKKLTRHSAKIKDGSIKALFEKDYGGNCTRSRCTKGHYFHELNQSCEEIPTCAENEYFNINKYHCEKSCDEGKTFNKITRQCDSMDGKLISFVPSTYASTGYVRPEETKLPENPEIGTFAPRRRQSSVTYTEPTFNTIRPVDGDVKPLPDDYTLNSGEFPNSNEELPIELSYYYEEEPIEFPWDVDGVKKCKEGATLRGGKCYRPRNKTKPPPPKNPKPKPNSK